MLKDLKISEESVHERKEQIDVDHEDVISFDCPKCPVELSSKEEFEKHIQSHELEFHEKPHYLVLLNSAQVDMTQFYKCKKCPKGFGMATDLSHHNAIVHEGKKLSYCDKCERKFVTFQSLMNHLKEVHKVERQL